MSPEQTQIQSTDEQARAQALSLKHLEPPTQVPGYEPLRFLGAGAYGEVWVAIDRNTGRQVAIKFYAHRGGLDWSLLSREVEKLAFLSADRYVVQLLDVGWEAEPPYYVMEYVERGSLEDLLRREGSLGARDAVEIFQEVAVGLLHAHAKGVLHCDLKPANVLLDQDGKPRLADFGQSRLSHEQTPALGTLFYMAPEQADLKAVPDVRWDVYALGALLYAMLTGAPPYRSDEALTEIETAANLDERLERYRQVIRSSPRPSAHRHVAGVDRALTEIIDCCLALDRRDRYANVQAVLDALQERKRRRAWRPLVVLGALGPALIVTALALLAWSWFGTLMGKADEELRARALRSNFFTAGSEATNVTNEIDKLYRAVEELAASPSFQRQLETALEDPELEAMGRQLKQLPRSSAQYESTRAQFLARPARRELQERLDSIFADEEKPRVASWLVHAPSGLQLARAPEGPTVGHNFAFRSYFSGRNDDSSDRGQPGKIDHVTKTHLSTVFKSKASDRWIVGVSTPVYKEAERETEKEFLGVVTLTREIHRFVELQRGSEQYAVLVDLRDGKNKGLILEHPLFDQWMQKHKELPAGFEQIRLSSDQLPEGDPDRRENYVDPVGETPEGAAFRKRWLAGAAPVKIRDGNTGWMVIVQESYDEAIGSTLDDLKTSLWKSGLMAVCVVTVLSTGLWAFVIRVLDESKRPSFPWSAAGTRGGDTPSGQ